MKFVKFHAFMIYREKIRWLWIKMDIKEAVQVAKQALLDVFDDIDKPTFRLEEVVLNDSSDWKITLSYQRLTKVGADQNGFTLLAAAMNKSRTYKVVIVGKHTGEVKAIKMYKDE